MIVEGEEVYVGRPAVVVYAAVEKPGHRTRSVGQHLAVHALLESRFACNTQAYYQIGVCLKH